jgi:hypothetical protein
VSPEGLELVDVDSLVKPEVRLLGHGVVLRCGDTRRVLTLWGLPLVAWEAGDAGAQRLAMALLDHQRLVPQGAIAAAFGVERVTVWRARRAWEAEGPAGVVPKKPGPKEPRVAKGRCRAQIVALGKRGFSRREVARRLGLAPQTVNGVFLEEGLGCRVRGAELFAEPARSAQGAEVRCGEPEEPAPSAGAAEVGCAGPQEPARLVGGPEVPACEVGPGDGAPARELDRVLAANGLLDEAKPEFVSGQEVPAAGALMALGLAAEAKTSLFQAAEGVYGALRPGFYGLRNLLCVLLLMALLRIRRTEGLASRPPQVLGRLLGLDRLPEVKTVRRKLNEVAARGKAALLMAAMADGWAAEMKDAAGFLLVDGHVRVYSGERPIPKAYSTSRRMATRAITDYWVNDEAGMPLFVVTAPTNPQLSKVLLDILAEAKSHVGDRPITVVFDRGGWKLKVLRELRKAGYHFLTYRRGKFRPYPRERLTLHEGEMEGRKVAYKLFDTHVRIRGVGRLRCVAVERGAGKQPHIVTTREDLPTLAVPYHISGRWRQENFFKYGIEHFGLDALVSYKTQPDDPERLVPNPAWRALSRRRGKARTELKALEAALGRLEASPTARNAARSVPFSRQELLLKIEKKHTQALRLWARLKALPHQVPLREAAGTQATVILEDERKRFTDLVKIVAYRIETELAGLIAPHYRRAPEEARALVRELLQTAGDLQVSNHTLTVRLRPLSAPRHTAAVAALCDILNQRHLHYPGTHLLLNFALKDESCYT